MPVPSSLATLSQTPASNSPDGGDNVFPLLDNYLREMFADFARLRDGTHQFLTSVSGTNTITAVNSQVGAYAAGQSFVFIAAGANTGAVTLNINGLGAKNVTKNGTTALVSGDIPANKFVRVDYDGTQFQLVGALYKDFLSKIVDVWVTSSDAYERFYFGNGGVTDIKGHGDPCIRFRNSAGTVIGQWRSSGECEGSVDATSGTAFPRLGQVNTAIATSQAAAVAAATAAATTAAQNSALGGPAQSYQNVIGSRAAGVDYTNSTGRPILVIAAGISGGGSPQQGVIFGTVDGVEVIYTSPFSNAGNYVHPISFIVPAGSTYSVGLSNLSLNRWVELR